MNFNDAQAGERHVWGDHTIGDKIDQIDWMTIEDSERMMPKRLW
mgnify:CR=1 FL=1